MSLNTDHLLSCILTLDASLKHLKAVQPESIEYDIFRNAAIKGFELSLETAGKLLRKAIKLYEANPKKVDELVFKDVLRHALKHGLVDELAIKRWFQYRDNRNNTAHDSGKEFIEETLVLLPHFLEDAHALQKILQTKLGQKDA
jgi:hypothetical protein